MILGEYKVDCRWSPAMHLSLWSGVLCFLAGFWMPVSWCYENGPVEYLQLACMGGIVFLCCRATQYREFFLWCAAVMLLLMLREINCGRTLFFAYPDSSVRFYKWSEIPYGWVVQTCYGVLIAVTVLWFFVRKLFVRVPQVLRMRPLPIGCVGILLTEIIIARVCETDGALMVWEELAELSVVVTGLIVAGLYSGMRCSR